MSEAGLQLLDDDIRAVLDGHDAVASELATYRPLGGDSIADVPVFVDRKVEQLLASGDVRVAENTARVTAFVEHIFGRPRKGDRFVTAERGYKVDEVEVDDGSRFVCLCTLYQVE